MRLTAARHRQHRVTGRACVGVDQRLDDLRVDLVDDVGLALEGDDVGEARALRDDDRSSEVAALAVLVADVLDEQHEQDVVLVLAGIHAATQFIARGPQGGVKRGLLNSHAAARSLDGPGGLIAAASPCARRPSIACLSRRARHAEQSFTGRRGGPAACSW